MFTVRDHEPNSLVLPASSMQLSAPDSTGPFRAVVSKPEHALQASLSKTFSFKTSVWNPAYGWSAAGVGFWQFAFDDVDQADEDLPAGEVCLSSDPGEWLVSVQEQVGGVVWVEAYSDLLFVTSPVQYIDTYSA